MAIAFFKRKETKLIEALDKDQQNTEIIFVWENYTSSTGNMRKPRIFIGAA